jgi:hypothetical protein
MTVALGRSASDHFRHLRFVAFGLFRFSLALAGEQSVLKIVNAFDHCCRLVAKLGHVRARHLAVLADCSCKIAKIVSELICAADNIIGGFFYLTASRQTNSVYSFNGDGGEL